MRIIHWKKSNSDWSLLKVLIASNAMNTCETYLSKLHTWQRCFQLVSYCDIILTWHRLNTSVHQIRSCMRTNHGKERMQLDRTIVIGKTVIIHPWTGSWMNLLRTLWWKDIFGRREWIGAVGQRRACCSNICWWPVFCMIIKWRR